MSEVELDLSPTRDAQAVTSEGGILLERIEGACIRVARTLPDERGSICEIFDPAWGFSDEPLVYVYETTIRPRRVKGWVVHYEQDDRLFFARGAAKVVLYDARVDSSTHGRINEVVVGEQNRSLLSIPKGVFHAIQNVGEVDMAFINMPTRPYRHENPDKYRLPLDTAEIPYSFADSLGW